MENIEAMLCAYIEGDLDDAGRAQIEKHLQENPRHQKLIQELMTTRDLVRDLPRVKAPVDVGESVRGRVERSILLDDSPQANRDHSSRNWLPQIFAVAAIFLLCASLCMILYKALAPTLKPAVFTENAAVKSSVMPAEQMGSNSPPTRGSAAVAMPAVAAPQAIAAVLPETQFHQSVVPVQQQSAHFLQINNTEAIRRQLRNSGYDIQNLVRDAHAPVLMVVNSSDPPATSVRVAQFLNDSSGISWKIMPSAESSPGATTLPSSSVGLQTSPMSAPATQPSSDVYVATGFTSKIADALRQSLSDRSDGAIQVSVESAAALATTQPSSSITTNHPTDLMQMAAPPVTTQPSEVASASDDLAVPSTMPSNMPLASNTPASTHGASQAEAAMTAVSGSANSATLQPVDAVIVIQPASAGLSNVMPSTRRSSASPTTQP